MKFTLTWMLRCEWDEIVKNRFSSSAPFPKSPTSIKSTGNSFAHHHQVSGCAKDKYRKPNIWNQISKTKYLYSFPKLPTNKCFSLSPVPPSIWILRQNKIFQTQLLTQNISSPNIEAKYSQPKYPKQKYWSPNAQTSIFQTKNSLKSIKTTSPVTAPKTELNWRNMKYIYFILYTLYSFSCLSNWCKKTAANEQIPFVKLSRKFSDFRCAQVRMSEM